VQENREELATNTSNQCASHHPLLNADCPFRARLDLCCLSCSREMHLNHRNHGNNLHHSCLLAAPLLPSRHMLCHATQPVHRTGPLTSQPHNGGGKRNAACDHVDFCFYQARNGMYLHSQPSCSAESWGSTAYLARIQMITRLLARHANAAVPSVRQICALQASMNHPPSPGWSPSCNAA
jgi:hypothetical protein